MMERKGIKEKQKNNSANEVLLKADFTPAFVLKGNISKRLLSKKHFKLN